MYVKELETATLIYKKSKDTWNFFLHILSFETYRKFSRKKYNSEIRTLVKNIKNK